MRPITVVVQPTSSYDVPIDQYITPQNIVWSASGGTVTAAGLVGEMSGFDGSGRPTNAPNYSVATASLTQPVTNGAYSAIRFSNAGGTPVTVVLNQAGITT